MLTHRNLLVNATQGAELVPLGAGDRVGMLLPLFHANAQVVTCLIPMMIRCEVVMWERFSASKFWETVEQLQPATISAVPTILAAVLNAPNAPGPENSLRYIICGAAPLSVDLLEAFRDEVRDPDPRGLRPDRDRLHLLDQPVLRGAQGRVDRSPDPRPADEDRRRGRIAGRQRRVRRDHHPRPERDARLSLQRGRDGGLDPRRLAAHRRHRLRRRRRLLLHRRSHQGHDHPRRREHLPAGDRGGHLPARGRAARWR